MSRQFFRDGKPVKLSKADALHAEQTTVSLRATYSERSMSIPFGVSDTFTVAQARNAGLDALEKHLQGLWKGDPPVILNPDNVDIRPEPKSDEQLVRDLGEDPSFLYWPRGDKPPADSPMASQVTALRGRELLNEEHAGGKSSAKDKSSAKRSLSTASFPTDANDVHAQIRALALELKDIREKALDRELTFEKLEGEMRQTKGELRQTKEELRQTKEELRQTKENLAKLVGECKKDRAVLHKIARRVLLDEAREKLASLVSTSWQGLVEPASAIQVVRERADAILQAADLKPSLSARRAKLLDILVDRNSTRDEGNLAAHTTTRELTLEAIEALDEGSERRALLLDIYIWIHGSAHM